MPLDALQVGDAVTTTQLQDQLPQSNGEDTAENINTGKRLNYNTLKCIHASVVIVFQV